MDATRPYELPQRQSQLVAYKNQTMVAHNTYEAKITILSNGDREVLQLLNHIDVCGDQLGSTSTYDYSASVVHCCRDTGITPRREH